VLPAPLRLNADPWRSTRPRRVGWAVAACLAARTDLLRSLGPFDPAQFLFYEDMDLCLRAAAAGIPTELHPGIAVVHTGGHSTGPAYGGEPHALLARRRRDVVASRLGRRAAALDGLAQAVTFATRAAARLVLRRDHRRERAQLSAVLAARRDGT
jgi:GT2 family glycosyltransferase